MSPNIFYIITFQKVMVTTRLRKYKSLGFRGQILPYIKCKKPQGKRERNIHVFYPTFRRMYIR